MTLFYGVGAWWHPEEIP